MTKQASSLLRGIRALTGKSDAVFGCVHGSSSIALASEPSKRFDCSEIQGEINSVLQELQIEGYVCSVGSNRYRLTSLALHPMQIFMLKAQLILLKDVFLPVFIAFLTSLATTLATLVIKGILS